VRDEGVITASAGPGPCFSCFSCALRAAFSACFCFFNSAPDSFGGSLGATGAGRDGLAGSAVGGG